MTEETATAQRREQRGGDVGASGSADGGGGGAGAQQQRQLERWLNRRYIYQNNLTGAVASSVQLMARQLCKILCPPVAAAAAGGGGGPGLRHITPDTQLLEVVTSTAEDGDDNGHDGPQHGEPKYSEEGWKPARSVPVLREATAMWYYSGCPSDNGDGTTATTTAADAASSSSSPAAQQTKARGPVTCRVLASDLAAAAASSSSSLETVRVYSDEITSGTWKTIDEIPYLKAAMQAFQDTGAATAKNTGGMDASESSPPDQQEYALEITAAGSDDDDDDDAKVNEAAVQKELERFLSATEEDSVVGGGGNQQRGKKRKIDSGDDADEQDVDHDEEEAYVSDGGTRYVKDYRTGNFVHEDLAPTKPDASKATAKSIATSSATATTMANPKKRAKNKGPKFNARNARCWIYVTGLPKDATEREVETFFSKAGILDLDPETQHAKIKLYRYREKDLGSDNRNGTRSNIQVGQCKGDASICYARPESVELALTLLDEAPFRPTTRITKGENGKIVAPNEYVLRVERAKFEQRSHVGGEGDGGKAAGNRRVVNNTKRKVARMAALQAIDWDDGESGGRLTGGRKGLRIIVLKHVFRPEDLEGATEAEETKILSRLETDIRSECEVHGVVEKITVFTKHPAGVVLVKFAQPVAASLAVRAMNGHPWKYSSGDGGDSDNKNNRRIEAIYWDGVTDYTVRDEHKEKEEMEKRHEEFGQWLEEQELPEEFKLQTDDE